MTLPTSTCRRCDQPIIQLSNGSWWHEGVDGGWWRGCRAASFDDSKEFPESAWNESLDRKWMALGPKKVRA